MSLVATSSLGVLRKTCYRSSSKESLFTSTVIDVWGVVWGGGMFVSNM